MSIIEVENVGIKFLVANDKVNSLKEFTTSMLKKKIKFREFWPIKDVSFQIEKGDVLGIVGRNGAGNA